MYMYTYVHTLVPIMHPDGAVLKFTARRIKWKTKLWRRLPQRHMGGAMDDTPLKSVEGSVIISAKKTKYVSFSLIQWFYSILLGINYSNALNFSAPSALSALSALTLKTVDVHGSAIGWRNTVATTPGSP